MTRLLRAYNTSSTAHNQQSWQPPLNTRKSYCSQAKIIPHCLKLVKLDSVSFDNRQQLPELPPLFQTFWAWCSMDSNKQTFPQAGFMQPGQGSVRLHSRLTTCKSVTFFCEFVPSATELQLFCRKKQMQNEEMRKGWDRQNGRSLPVTLVLKSDSVPLPLFSVSVAPEKK